jgi:hypothetical protein
MSFSVAPAAGVTQEPELFSDGSRAPLRTLLTTGPGRVVGAHPHRAPTTTVSGRQWPTENVASARSVAVETGSIRSS